MTVVPGLRRIALVAHVSASLGWFGAVLTFLAVGIVALISPEEHAVRGAYLVMDPVARLVLVPLSIASLVTGVISSLSTQWGLVRHYWVVFKLVINVVATLVLLMYLETFRLLRVAAADLSAPLALVRNPSPVVHAVLALILLLAATTLGVFRPRGMTLYGWRKKHGA
ncbi:MAG: DUF2269 domain-containing protein [Polyangiaceae bacterium]|nr:DUF2269 domain-containing protein [Polyangiaceae bacterium]